VLSVCDGIVELLGFRPEDFLTGAVTLIERIHPHDQDIAEIWFGCAREEARGALNVRVRQANGRIRCIKGEYDKSLTDSGGVVLELLLTDAKSLPRTLDDASSTLNFRAMMENSDDYIYFKDRNHVFTGASQTLVACVIRPSIGPTCWVRQTMMSFPRSSQTNITGWKSRSLPAHP
jgi:hypothetical protein